MRTIAEIAVDLAEASRELEAQRQQHARLVVETRDVVERIAAARTRAQELRDELVARSLKEIEQP